MYLVLFVFSILTVLFSLIVQRNYKVSLVVSCGYLFIVSLIFGFRDGVGVDYYNYESYYLNSHDAFNHEYGYSLLNYVFFEFGFPFYSVTLIVSLLTNSLVLIGIWLSGLRGVYLHLGVLLYASNVMLFSLNGMRQALALAFVFAFSTFLVNGKAGRFIAGCFLGSLFHISAIGLIALFFLRNILKRYWLAFFLFLSVLSVFFAVWFFDFNRFLANAALYIPYYSKYFDLINNMSTSSVGAGVALRLIFSCALLLYFLTNRKDYKDNDNMVISIFIISLFFNVLAATNFMWARIGIYFSIFEVVAMPLIIRKVNNDLLRGCFFVVAVFYAVTFLVVSLFIIPESNQLVYKSVFN